MDFLETSGDSLGLLEIPGDFKELQSISKDSCGLLGTPGDSWGLLGTAGDMVETHGSVGTENFLGLLVSPGESLSVQGIPNLGLFEILGSPWDSWGTPS